MTHHYFEDVEKWHRTAIIPNRVKTTAEICGCDWCKKGLKEAAKKYG